jgi:hypothetical protein
MLIIKKLFSLFSAVVILTIFIAGKYAISAECTGEYTASCRDKKLMIDPKNWRKDLCQNYYSNEGKDTHYQCVRVSVAYTCVSSEILPIKKSCTKPTTALVP